MTVSVGLDGVGLVTVVLGAVGVRRDVVWVLQLVVILEDDTCAWWLVLEGGLAVVPTTRFTEVVEEQVTVLNPTSGTVAVCEAQLMVVQGAWGAGVVTPTVSATVRVLPVM